MHLQAPYGVMVYNAVHNVLTGITVYGTHILILKNVRLHATAVILVVLITEAIIAEMEYVILARHGTVAQQTAAQVDILEVIMGII